MNGIIRMLFQFATVVLGSIATGGIWEIMDGLQMVGYT